MGKTERRWTAAVAAVVFTIGAWVVVFAPFMVNEGEDGQHSIIDYSFTKGIEEARLVAAEFCAERGQSASPLEKKRRYKRTQNTTSLSYIFTCVDA